MKKVFRNGGLNRVACWCRKSPAIFLMFILTIITITETIVKFFFHHQLLVPYGPLANILESIICTVFFAPAIFFLVFKPLLTEISRRQSAEDFLLSARKEWEDTFDCITDLITIHDLEMNIIKANRAAVQTLGLVQQDGHYGNGNRHFHGTDSRPDSCPLRRTIETGEPACSEFFEPHLQMFIEVRTSPRFDKAGMITGLIHIVRDIGERKIAEELLRFSEERFRDTFERAAVGICNFSLDGRYFKVNQWLCDILGYSMQEMLALSIIDVTLPEDRTISLKRLREIVNGTIDSYTLEKRFVHKDGTTIWVYSIAALKRKPSGEPDFIIGVIHDISQQKEAEEALLRSEKLLSEAQEMANLGWFLLDIKMGSWESSPVLDDIFGIDADYVRDLEHWLSLVIPESRVEMEAYIDWVLLTGERFSKDYRIIRVRNGEERWVSGIGELEYDLSGEPARLIGTIQDITDRRQAEIELKASEERFSQVFAQEDDALLILRAGSLEIIDSNPKAVALFGLNKDNLLRIRPDTFMEAGDFRKFTEALTINDPSRGFLIDRMVCTTAGGAKVVVSLRAKILSLKNEAAIFCSLRDITEKISLEEEIRSTQAKLIHTNKMTSLGMLASSIAHEINNPNNYISINAKMLASIWQDARPILRKTCDEQGELSLMRLPFEKVEEMAPRLFDAIIDGSSRISAIVDNMKNFVRAGSNGLKEEIDVNRLVQNAVTLLWHHINKHSNRFRTSLQDSLPVVRGNGQQIEQVVVNLITNALEALPDKTFGVTITTAWDGESGHVSITVRDDGKGMDRNTLEHISEPFFTTKHDSGGTGLGLYISDSIIKGHNGRLLFESEPGRGTTATILLPVG
jgi:PAS domain S-box-containing protein